MCLTVSACKTSSDLNPLLTKIPSNDAAVALIQDPNQLLIDTMRWLERALGPSGRAISDRLRREGRRILGFDPVTSSLSEKLHLNNDMGLALFSPGLEQEPILIAQSTRPKELLETLHSWYRRIDASAKMESRTVAGGRIKLQHYGKPFGKDLITVFIVRQLDDGWFIAGGAESSEALAAYQPPKHENSLAKDPHLTQLKAKPKPDVQLWAPPALLFGKSTSPLNQSSRGVLSSIDVTPKGIRFVSEAPIALTSFLGAMATPSLADLLARTDDDNFFVAATRLAQLQTLTALSAHPPWQAELIDLLTEATEETGLDIQKDVIPQLNGDVLVSAALSSTADLGGLRRLNNQRSLSKLGSQFRGRIYLGLKDPKVMRELLLKGLSKLQQEGQPLKHRTTKQGYLLVEPAVAEPAFGWGIGHSHYVYSLGVGELEQALASIENASGNSVLASRYGTTPNTSIAIVRLGVLSQALRSLSVNAGLAPQLQGLVQPALGALERIGDISMQLEFTDTSLRLSLTETLP